MTPLRSLLVLLALFAVGCAGGVTSTSDDAAGTPSDPPTSPDPSDGASDGAPPPCAAGDFPWDIGAPAACTPVTADGFTYAEIRRGGPPPDGIPPIDEPRFESLEAADAWLSPQSPVVAVSIDGDARAYPLAILTWHEIVNDEIAGVPLTVTYCPLCNSALVFDRRVDGEVLDFGTSGRLYRSNLVMYDRQTRTLWSQFTGEAVVGPAYVGTTLTRIASSLVSWSDFQAAAPDGRVLSRDTGHVRRYGDNPYVGYDDEGREPFLYDGPSDDRLAAMTRVVGLPDEDGGGAVAVVREHLAQQGTLAVELGDRQVVLSWAGGTTSALDTREIDAAADIGSVAVFETRTAAGTEVALATSQDGHLVDETTGTRWDRLGGGLDGPLSGEALVPVAFDDTFWFVWFAFLPDTALIGDLG